MQLHSTKIENYNYTNMLKFVLHTQGGVNFWILNSFLGKTFPKGI